MGNVCGVVREAIYYVLRYILPRYTSYFPGGYNTLTAQDINSVEAFDITQESETLSIKDRDTSINTERVKKWDYSENEITGNTNYLLDIVSSFFKNYNFQMQVLSGKTYEKNLKNKGKYEEKLSLNWPKENKFIQPNWNIAREDFISSFNDIKIDATNSNSESESIDGHPRIDISVQNGRRSTREHFHGTENSKENDEIVTIENSKENDEIVTKSNLNLSNKLRRKYGITLTDEISRRRENHARNLSRSFSHVDSNSQNSNDSRSTDRQAREKKRPQARKLSLQRMHSGCHYSENEGDDDVKLADYSRESPPLIVPIECYRTISNPNLCSGGLVAFHELARHLSIPDYYGEHPTVYDELPKGIQIPITSTLELPSQEPPVRPTSCSGGGLVPVNTRRVSLPDIYPERNPLLQATSSEDNAQSSSSGILERDEIIFSDLITESLRYDGLVVSQMPEETFTQPRRVISRYASETEVLTAASQRCVDDNNR